MRAEDIFDKEFIQEVREACRIFNGKVVDICMDVEKGFKRLI